MTIITGGRCACGAPITRKSPNGRPPIRCENCRQFLAKARNLGQRWEVSRIRREARKHKNPMTDEEKRASQREGTRKYREKRFREIASMPKIPCACGCGTMIAPINKTLKPGRFAHGHNVDGKQTQFRMRQNIGPLNARWRGGKTAHGSGYVMLLVDSDHPMANGRRYVLAHRLVMSEAIGRPLRSSEQVHHLNGDRGDNRLENLQLLQRFHAPGGAFRCCQCGSHDVEPVPLKEG